MTSDQQRGGIRPDLAEPSQERQSVHSRHLDVADNRFIVLGRDPFESPARGLRLVDDDFFHAQLKHLAQRFQQGGVVVDEQNVRPVVHASPSFPSSGLASGRRIRKQAPCPGRLTTEIDP